MAGDAKDVEDPKICRSIIGSRAASWEAMSKKTSSPFAARAIGKSICVPRLDTVVAVAALWALWKELPEETDDISVPGIPDDDAEFNAFDRWTAGLLRKAVKAYATAGGMSTETLISEAIASACKKREVAQEEERDLLERGKQWELRLEQESRRRMLLEPDVLDKVARYESGLERSLFRTLHELQRLQAARSGVTVPVPATIDVDLTVNSKAS